MRVVNDDEKVTQQAPMQGDDEPKRLEQWLVVTIAAAIVAALAVTLFWR